MAKRNTWTYEIDEIMYISKQNPVRPINAARVQVSSDLGEDQAREVFEENGEALFGTEEHTGERSARR